MADPTAGDSNDPSSHYYVLDPRSPTIDEDIDALIEQVLSDMEAEEIVNEVGRPLEDGSSFS